ncbi:MMPL family transporter [Yoonia sp. GPGPB17]|uniref:efflux RND transporter permease subunit n=1 Tax=Yoonia sp. GPGPB17 TaxID=3026147 RepID=UPI0030BB792E
MMMLRRDIVALTLFAMAAIVALALSWAKLTTDADLIATFESASEAYSAFIEHRDRFGDDTRDAVIAVRSETVLSVASLEDLVIELQLTPGVDDVLSVLSLPASDGSGESFLNSADIVDRPAREQFALMRDTIPFGADLISSDGRLTLVMVLFEEGLELSAYASTLAEPLSLAPPELALNRVGTPRLEMEINAALVRDQTTITPIAVIFGLILILLVFRSWRAVLICGAPIIVAMSLFLGGLAALGIPVSPMLSLVPIILVVLGFADSIHFFYAICRQGRTEDVPSAVATAHRHILPAIASTTLTTVLAFLAMLLIDSAALRELSLVGSAGMLIMLFVVATLVPVLARLLLTPHETTLATATFRRVSQMSVAMLAYAKPLAIASIVLIALLGAAQRHVVTGYDPLQHIPRSSTFADDIAALEAGLPGSGRYNVIIEGVTDGPDQSAQNAQRLQLASQAALGKPISLAPEIASQGVTGRLVDDSASSFSLPVPTSLLSGPDTIRTEVSQIKARLDAAGVGDFATVTGYSFLAATQMPVLVDGLRLSFYIAIVVMTLLIALILRSLPIALVTLVPNLLPILGIEAWMVLTSQTVTITGAVALLVAFGIAVDNTIHIVNRVRLLQRDNPAPQQVIEHALDALVSPVMTTSILLIVGFSMTAFSALPAVSLFGMLTAMAIIIALLADLLIFPSLLLVLLRKGWI